MRSRLGFGLLGILGVALLAASAADWLFYQSFVASLVWR
jgi:hypothetical protein